MTGYDAAIVGAGPAGMAAATCLRRLGASVLVVDEGPAPGGQIWRRVEANVPGPLEEALGQDYAKGVSAVAAFRTSGADYRPGTQVWQIEDGWRLFLTLGGRASMVTARAVLLATGAQERPVPFPGWTLPGVMTVGAAQILLKSGGLLPEGPLWIAGTGPLPLLYATQVLDLGGRIAGILDTAPRPGLGATRHLPSALHDFGSLRKGMAWQRRLRRSGCRIVRRVSAVAAEGEGRLRRLRWTAGGRSETAEAGVLLVHEGVVPQIHASLALGCAHDWRVDQSCLVPRLDAWGQTTRPGLFVAGDAGGIGGWAAAALGGEIAALGIAQDLGMESDFEALRRNLDRRRAKTLAIRPLLDALYPPPRQRIADDTIVCRCEELTAGVVRAAARAGAPDPNAVKAATRAGMGPCQGRQCGYTVQALIAEVHGIDLTEVGFFNIRPPLKPVTLGELAELAEQEDAA
jgi:NADPH-dependent 2,4-dienoyl-CoA reductase/sulfur reductase-like enzyme